MWQNGAQEEKKILIRIILYFVAFFANNIFNAKIFEIFLMENVLFNYFEVKFFLLIFIICWYFILLKTVWSNCVTLCSFCSSSSFSFCLCLCINCCLCNCLYKCIYLTCIQKYLWNIKSQQYFDNIIYKKLKYVHN